MAPIDFDAVTKAVTGSPRHRRMLQSNAKFFYGLVVVVVLVMWCRPNNTNTIVKLTTLGAPIVDYKYSGFFKSLDPHIYQPASVEQYILNHPHELNYDNPRAAKVCPIWKNQTATEDIYQSLHTYIDELRQYNKLLDAFKPIDDLRKSMDLDMTLDTNHEEVCQAVQLHPDGLAGIFKSSGQLSYTQTSGYIEPLWPPLRHPANCLKTPNFNDLKDVMRLDYLVHDFEYMCQRLKKTSRTVLIDMGASLSFHGVGQKRSSSPAVYLMDLFTKFGMPFDHIYAYEMTPTEPGTAFSQVPPEYLSAYHWINVGVSADKKSRLNPLNLILNDFNENDFIVVKLDIDTPSIELPLAHQLLENPKFHKLVDHFYFEHHVKLEEILRYWGSAVSGTVQESMELFMNLRKKGIPAHSWV